MSTDPKAPLPYQRILLALACIPTVDSILNQVSGTMHWMIGPVSLLQAFRGMLLFAFVVFVLWRIQRDPRALSSVPLPAMAALLLLGIIITKELVSTGSLASDAAVAYGQMAYWVLLWIVASLTCTQSRQAEMLLRGLALGAVVTAVSVILGLAYGSVNYYETDDVHSSAGWFNTAKMISATLVSGTIVILYLGRNKKSLLSASLALLCSIACFLTYARAGTVALCCAILWLLVWYLRSYRTHPWHSLKFFLGMFTTLVLVAIVSIPQQTLFSRWSDMSDSDQAGSGRASIWRVAVDSFADASTSAQLLGSGYNAMSETLLRGYGEDVKHTHNDTLDMLLVAGALGLIWLAFMVGTWISGIVRTSIWSPEGAAAGAILLNYLCHSQLTGQLWGTDSMTYYVIAILSFSVLRKSVPKTEPMMYGYIPNWLQHAESRLERSI